LRDDVLHALTALIADRAGDGVAVDDFCGHVRPDAIELVTAIMLVSLDNGAVPQCSLRLARKPDPERKLAQPQPKGKTIKTLMSRRRSGDCSCH
jgi:hypothetical protein